MPRNGTAVAAQEPTPAQVAARAAASKRMKKLNKERTGQKPEQRRNVPIAAPRKARESSEHQIGMDRPRDLPVDGPARLEPAHVEVVDKPLTSVKADALKFNEEVLTVIVHESSNPTDHPCPEIEINGRIRVFPRGEEVKVERYFVEQLCRLKKTTYSQKKVEDANGIKTYRNIPHTSVLYPFAVMHDPNPLGQAWLKNTLNSA